MLKMRIIILLFLLIGLNAQAQELIRITDFQKQLLDYDDQSFFEYQENTYEYHTAGKHIVVTEVSSSTEIYKSRRTLCDENLMSCFYYNGNMVIVGSLGFYVEGIFDGEDMFIEYEDFEISDSYIIEQINSICHIHGYQIEITIDLDIMEIIDDKNYVFTTNNSYFYKVDNQLVKENRITKETSILASFTSSLRLYPLGDKSFISLGDQNCIILDEQDVLIAELTDVPFINTVLQPPNTDYFVVVSNNMELQHFDSNTYEKLEQFAPLNIPFSQPTFRGSTSSGIYISTYATGSTSSLLFWNYQLSELQTIYDSNISPLYIIHSIENKDYYVIQDLNDIVVFDKSDNSYFRTQNVYNRYAFWEYIKFVNVDGEDKLLIQDSNGYVYYHISSDLELVDPVQVQLEDGLGEDVMKNGNLYLLNDFGRGLDKIEYLYGEPLELK